MKKLPEPTPSCGGILFVHVSRFLLSLSRGGVSDASRIRGLPNLGPCHGRIPLSGVIQPLILVEEGIQTRPLLVGFPLLVYLGVLYLWMRDWGLRLRREEEYFPWPLIVNLTLW